MCLFILYKKPITQNTTYSSVAHRIQVKHFFVPITVLTVVEFPIIITILIHETHPPSLPPHADTYQPLINSTGVLLSTTKNCHEKKGKNKQAEACDGEKKKAVNPFVSLGRWVLHHDQSEFFVRRNHNFMLLRPNPKEREIILRIKITNNTACLGCK
jgi:hypothetical protein